MDHKIDWEFEQTLADTEMLLKNAAKSASDEENYSLDSILAEFGHSAAEHAVPSQGEDVSTLQELSENYEKSAAQTLEEEPSSSADPESAPEEPLLQDMFGDAPRGVSLQDVLQSTVQSVLEEEPPSILEPPKRRGLFSRRKLQDTEQLYDMSPQENEEEEEDDSSDDFRTPEGSDTPTEELVSDYRELALQQRHSALISSVITGLMWCVLALDHFGIMPEFYQQEPLLHCLPYGIALLLLCLVGRDVFVYAFEQLCDKRVTYELLSAVVTIAALADTVLTYLLPSRSAVAATPFHAIAALQMTCALWGRSFLFRAMYDTFRVCAMGEPTYLVTITAGGAAKRIGASSGFSTCAQKDDSATYWQSILLPVILTAVFLFSLLATLQCGHWSMLLWNFSVILSGANMLAFPLVYSLPLRRLTRRFIKSGSALAGYIGAKRLQTSNCVILTDQDLFPPGTISLNGLKIYGEESGKVISYAATMAHASQSGLARLFDSLLQSEGASLETLDNLNFYEEGGVSGLIRGESVLFGTAAFCRKMGVAMPGGLNLKTGVFLAVDRTLIAVFAVKYMAAENVDWALHALRRNHITPVLAVRDGNITPQLLKRKFGTDAKSVYPTISTRLALSEREGTQPYALLYREGLMPYAEVAVGSKRLVRAVRSGTILSLLGSTLSTLLAFYLTFVGAYTLLAPLSMLFYLLLWAFACLIDCIFVDRY